MSDELSRRRSLDSLKKEAKRWLDALRANDAAARARLAQALTNAPDEPTLRDVQHALAREHGFAGWTALKDAIERAREQDREHGVKALASYEEKAVALLEAYRTGTPEAMERHYRLTWHRRSWQGMRTYVQGDLGKRIADDVDITLDDARLLVANEHGFNSWDEVKAFTARSSSSKRLASRPVSLVEKSPDGDVRTLVASRDWDDIIGLLAGHPTAGLAGHGQMTDAILADVARVDSIKVLALGGSKELTDDGIRHLAKLTGLTRLDLSGTGITDRGLAVLRALPNLKFVWLGGTAITDAGVAQLADCHAIESVDLSWTRTGDDAIRALAGKQELRFFRSGNSVTDAGIPLLHNFPVYKTWRGGETKISLMSYESEPNQLALRGSFTDRGMQHMRGLDGLFGLNIDDSALALTAAAVEPLTSLPNLGWLAADAKDDWMHWIARMPKLRFLGAQDTSAGDDGFSALSKSQSLEFIWGRRTHNLRRRGFQALAKMPALRGLSLSCLNVDDSGVASLPEFPALRELMPMDIPDAGYRHIGNCSQLESLILMYCRDTTDAATEQITGLTKLEHYFNSYTQITDRTPELLSTMDSLRRVIFDSCHNLTNAGIARLARLPRLDELRVSARQVTTDVATLFPPTAHVHID